jgi:hypothetical protein
MHPFVIIIVVAVGCTSRAFVAVVAASWSRNVQNLPSDNIITSFFCAMSERTCKKSPRLCGFPSARNLVSLPLFLCGKIAGNFTCMCAANQ